MAATLKVDNYGSLNIGEGTQLDADAAAGVQTFTVKNSQQFVVGGFFILGTPGDEACEKLTVQTVPDAATITTTAVSKRLHKRFEQVTLIIGDQIKVYSAPNATGALPPDSAFALLGSAINIDIDNLFTTVTDAAGGSNTWYKFTYFNSSTSVETSLADSGAARGGGYGHYTTLDAIRGEAGFNNNPNITDSLIDSRRIDAEDEINAALTGVYAIPFVKPIPGTIENVSKLIAAGLLLLGEYGAVTTGSNKEGNDKLKQGRDLLSRIQQRQLSLLDSAGNSLLQSSGVRSWPDDTTASLTEDDNGGDFQFKATHRY